MNPHDLSGEALDAAVAYIIGGTLPLTESLMLAGEISCYKDPSTRASTSPWLAGYNFSIDDTEYSFPIDLDYAACGRTPREAILRTIVQRYLEKDMHGRMFDLVQRTLITKQPPKLHFDAERTVYNRLFEANQQRRAAV